MVVGHRIHPSEDVPVASVLAGWLDYNRQDSQEDLHAAMASELPSVRRRVCGGRVFRFNGAAWRERDAYEFRAESGNVGPNDPDGHRSIQRGVQPLAYVKG